MPDEQTLSQIDAYIDDHVDQFIDMLARLVAQPSVAAQDRGIDDCAALVAEMLAAQELDAEIMPSEGNPVVYAEGEGAGDDTLMFYLHYDVQPAEPLELWESPPWELTRRGKKLYGRGISDDKGHIVARLAAVEAVRHVMGGLPANVKFVIEGEEEIGSVNLPPFIEQHKEKLAADACIWEFGGVDLEGRPRQVLGMRGICYVELSARTADVDTHSGLGGSVFPNAAWRLTWALSTLKDQGERILLPDYYENVKPPSERDLELLRQMPNPWDKYKKMFGIDHYLNNMQDPLELHRVGVFEPTCTICGLTSGYQGPGSKTVLPAEASAKVDFRLVPDQTPDEVLTKLRAHLDAHGFEDIEITYLGGEPPGRTDPDHPFIALINDAAAEVYGESPVIVPMIGGSGPNHAFIHTLGLPVGTAGVGYPGSNAHAPNEHVIVDNFISGTKHTAHVLVHFGAGAE